MIGLGESWGPVMDSFGILLTLCLAAIAAVILFAAGFVFRHWMHLTWYGTGISLVIVLIVMIIIVICIAIGLLLRSGVGS